MQSVFVIVITLATVVVLLHRKIEIGHATFAGAVLLQLLTWSPPNIFLDSVVMTLKNPNTWEILVALYFVMCLEFQLRTSGLLDGIMAAAREHLLSDKFLLAGMPAFLGFLPSLGGALFSAPMVENASRRYEMTSEDKATVNLWFRHVWEFVNPIMPGLLLLSQITQFPLPVLIVAMAPYTIAAAIIGWIFCLMRLREKSVVVPLDADENNNGPEKFQNKSTRAISLTVGPIVLNIVLVVGFHLSASLSMALVVGLMILVLKQNVGNVKKMLIHGFDRKLLWGISSVLLFQQALHDTGALAGIVSLFQAFHISPLMVAGILAFVAGILTGTSSGFVAVAMPIIVALAPGNLAATVVGFVAGTAGQMLSPMHLCILVTVKYFEADFVRCLRPMAVMEILMVCALTMRYVFF